MNPPSRNPGSAPVTCSIPFIRSQLIWIYSVFKTRINPGSAGYFTCIPLSYCQIKFMRVFLDSPLLKGRADRTYYVKGLFTLCYRLRGNSLAHYAPNSEKVEEAYYFGLCVLPFVCVSVPKKKYIGI